MPGSSALALNLIYNVLYTKLVQKLLLSMAASKTLPQLKSMQYTLCLYYLFSLTFVNFLEAKVVAFSGTHPMLPQYRSSVPQMTPHVEGSGGYCH